MPAMQNKLNEKYALWLWLAKKNSFLHAKNHSAKGKNKTSHRQAETEKRFVRMSFPRVFLFEFLFSYFYRIGLMLIKCKVFSHTCYKYTIFTLVIAAHSHKWQIVAWHTEKSVCLLWLLSVALSCHSLFHLRHFLLNWNARVFPSYCSGSLFSVGYTRPDRSVSMHVHVEFYWMLSLIKQVN